MVTPDGKPVILDFGLARDVDERPADADAGPATSWGRRRTCRPSRSPRRRIKLDRRTDVYSLGVSLFECLTLRRPFEAPTREGLYQAILTKAPPDLAAAEPGDPRRISGSSSRPRSRRTATAGTRPRSTSRRSSAASACTSRSWRSRSGRSSGSQRWAQRNPGLAAAIGGLFVVLAIGLAVALFLLGQRDRALAEVTTERNEKQARSPTTTASATFAPAATAGGGRHALARRAVEGRRDEGRGWTRARSSRRASRPPRSSSRACGSRRQPVLPESRPGESRPADSRPAWRFATDAEQFKHDTTAKLVADLTAFVDPNPKKGLLADVRARLAFAESVERETLGKHEAKWAEAIRSIADAGECPKYGGLRIKPQLGLIPIGKERAGPLGVRPPPDDGARHRPDPEARAGRTHRRDRGHGASCSCSFPAGRSAWER